MADVPSWLNDINQVMEEQTEKEAEESMAPLAKLTGTFYRLLLKEGLSKEAADRIVGDMNLIVMSHYLAR